MNVGQPQCHTPTMTGDGKMVMTWGRFIIGFTTLNWIV